MEIEEVIRFVGGLTLTGHYQDDAKSLRITRVEIDRSQTKWLTTTEQCDLLTNWLRLLFPRAHVVIGEPAPR